MPDTPPYKELEKRGEEIYDELYEHGGSGLLSEIKECLTAAAAAAEEAGLAEEAKRLRARLDHIVAVHRSQLS